MSKSKKEKSPSIHSKYITLPWSAFFDQELGDVIYNKLMKAPVKDYQVLLRLSKLWQTINEISKSLVEKRDELAKEAGVLKYLNPETPLTPEELNSQSYQEKAKAFWQLLQEKLFNTQHSLEPLGTLILDLTNPDGHAKAFLEWASLSADDIMKLEEAKIVSIIWPEDDKPTTNDSKPSKEKTEEETKASEPEDDVLVPNEENNEIKD